MTPEDAAARFFFCCALANVAAILLWRASYTAPAPAPPPAACVDSKGEQYCAAKLAEHGMACTPWLREHCAQSCVVCVAPPSAPPAPPVQIAATVVGEWRSFSIATADSIGRHALGPLCPPPRCLLEVFLCPTTAALAPSVSASAWYEERDAAIGRMRAQAGLPAEAMHLEPSYSHSSALAKLPPGSKGRADGAAQQLPPCGGPSFWHRALCWQRVKRHEAAEGARFDWVAVLRFDVGYYAPLPPIWELSRDDSRLGVVVPGNHGLSSGLSSTAGHMSDHFALISRALGAADAFMGEAFSSLDTASEEGQHQGLMATTAAAVGEGGGGAGGAYALGEARVLVFGSCQLRLGPKVAPVLENRTDATAVQSWSGEGAAAEPGAETVLEATLQSWGTPIHYAYVPWVLVRAEPSAMLLASGDRSGDRSGAPSASPSSSSSSATASEAHGDRQGPHQAECFRQKACCVTSHGACHPTPACAPTRVADCAAAFRGHACVAPRKLGSGHRFFRCTEDELK